MGTVIVFVAMVLFTMVSVKMVEVFYSAQPQVCLATTIDALLIYFVFYYGWTVVVRGVFEERDGFWFFMSAGIGRCIHVLVKSICFDAGVVEVRGEFWDLGWFQQ